MHYLVDTAFTFPLSLESGGKDTVLRHCPESKHKGYIALLYNALRILPYFSEDVKFNTPPQERRGIVFMLYEFAGSLLIVHHHRLLRLSYV